MATHDKEGNAYARIVDLKAGDKVELDESFSCAPAGQTTIEEIDGHLYFNCDEGRHYLVGQDDGDGYCIGIYKIEEDKE